MAIQSAFYFTDGTTRTFPSTKHIASSSNVAVWMKRVVDDVWELTSYELWTLANNSIVFTVAPQSTVYSQIELRIADEADELTESPSNIALVAGSIVNVDIVATNINAVNTVSTNITAVQNTSANTTNINTVATNIDNVNTVGTNIANVNTTASNIANVNAVGSDLLEPISEINTVATDIANVNTVGLAITAVNTVATNITNVNSVATTIIPNIAEILLADDNATIATTKASEASASAISTQLDAWIAEAEAMTSEAYATTPLNTFVSEYTSNGDGTFTATLTTNYSSLHWAATIDNANFVHKTGDETVAGIKTFSSPIKLSSSGFTTTLQSGTLSGDVVHTLPKASGELVGGGNQTIAGVKTFSSSPIVPTPSAQDNSTKVATTAYVDGKMVLATAVTASGTAIDFTGIPSWAKRITVILNGISLSGSSVEMIQIGSGSIQTTGYKGSVWNGTGTASVYTNGFKCVSSNAPTDIKHIIMTLIRIAGNTWVASLSGGYETVYLAVGGGSVTLSGVLNIVRITTANGTDTFDAGQINIMYEG